MLAIFLGPVAAPPCTLPNKSMQRQGNTTALRGECSCFFFWTISAANPERTMRSARPPLFVTLFDTLLGRFWRFLGSFWRPERLWGGAGSDERNEARLHGSTNGSGGADGGSDGARPGSAGAPFGRIVEPMAPNRVPKWLQNGSQRWPRRNSEKCAPAQAGAHLSLSRWV